MNIIFKKKKKISRIAIEGMAMQIIYLVLVKHVSTARLIWHIKNMLNENGIPTEYISSPRPEI